ncbi:hypothetical protein ACGFYF_34425 [Streptomyces lavendulae]|uniref:hypothetical protein n=1 Tax=Streptomyces lavendulae TaxID=1914 RepID=UPI003714B8D0
MGRTKWAAGVAAGAVGLAGAGVVVAGGLLWPTAGDDTDHGWFRVRELGPAAAGGGPSRAEAQAGLTDAAAAAGLTPGPPPPRRRGPWPTASPTGPARAPPTRAGGGRSKRP